MSRLLPLVALAIGAVGTLVVALVATRALEPAAGAWLAASLFWLSIPLGALALVFIHDLTGGRWGLTIAGPMRAAIAALPLLLLLFLPLLFALPSLYSWARPEEAGFLDNRFYLNEPFFIARFAACALIWIALAGLALWRSSLWRGDPLGGGSGLSGLALILLALTVTVAAIDWVMSLEPHWKSEIFGLLVGAGQLVAALAFLILARLTTRARSAPGEGPLADRFHDLGTLLLAIVLVWAYFEFIQFLIVWEENLQDEIGWYLQRTTDGWGTVMAALAICHFAIPLLALVWAPVKRSRPALGLICALVLLAGLGNLWWMVVPDLPGGFTWIDPVAAIAVGALLVALMLIQLRRDYARTSFLVMAGLAPGIHAVRPDPTSPASMPRRSMDARDKPGHDGDAKVTAHSRAARHG